MNKTVYILTSDGKLVSIHDDTLSHAAFGKGEERENHKYISREWKNGRWIYTYKDDIKGGKTGASKGVGTGSSPTKEPIAQLRKPTVVGTRSNGPVAALARGVNYLKQVVGAAKRPEKPNVSSEYQSEVESNSKENEYPKNETDKAQKTVETGVKKTESFLEKIGNAVSSAIETAATEGMKWAGNLFESYQTAAKDAKAAWDESKRKVEETENESKESMGVLWAASYNYNVAVDEANAARNNYIRAGGGEEADRLEQEYKAAEEALALREAELRSAEKRREEAKKANSDAIKEEEKARKASEDADSHPLRQLDDRLQELEDWLRDYYDEKHEEELVERLEEYYNNKG